MVKIPIRTRIALIVSILLLVLLGTSCDFSSRLHKDILNAQKSLYEHDYLKAANLYENILKSNPPTKIKIKILYQVAEIYSIHLGKSEEAISYFKDIESLTDDPFWLVKVEEKMGDLYFNFLKDYLKAIDVYQKLIAFKPLLEKHDFYQFRLGIAYLEAKKINKAIEVFEEIKKSSEHSYYIDSFFYLGLSYFHLEKWDKSLDFWKEHLNKEKNKEKKIQTKFLMANSYEMMEKLEEAYDIYYSILGDYPNVEVVKNRMKSIYSRKISRKR